MIMVRENNKATMSIKSRQGFLFCPVPFPTLNLKMRKKESPFQTACLLYVYITQWNRTQCKGS